jgi:MoaA/NifB/PqqE/SkfB family radical SAM enzyme
VNHVIESLPVLVLYPHSRCNCRCVMCDIWKTDTAEEITAGELERHLADIASLHVEWLVFSGGEPLMHTDLFRLSALARARGIRTTVLSTGLLLSRYARQVVESVDDVIVSLDGPPSVHDSIRRVAGAFDLLAAGVRAVGTDFPVAARCTVQRANVSKLRETVATARGLGLRSISFLAADVSSTAFNRPDGWQPAKQATVAPAADEIPLLGAEIEGLIREECDGGFVVENPEKLRRIVRHFRAHHGLVEPEAPRCNAPWVSAVVEADGTVRPCFFHPPVGNARVQSLAAVINGPQAIEFRSALQVAENPVCRRCVCSLYRPEVPSLGAIETINK